jgi:hypothetical protein
MSIFIAALLASSQPMPFIDRASINNLSALEALEPNGSRGRDGSSPALLRTNVRVIAAICDAAASASDPVKFLSDISRAYSMKLGETGALREACAVYLSGREAGLSIR